MVVTTAVDVLISAQFVMAPIPVPKPELLLLLLLLLMLLLLLLLIILSLLLLLLRLLLALITGTVGVGVPPQLLNWDTWVGVVELTQTFMSSVQFPASRDFFGTRP